MKKIVFLTIVILALSLNAFSADTFIGHAYYFRCPSLGCVDEAIYARPLFKKTQNGWQAFPNGKELGNTPNALDQSYKLFPSEIKWNIYDEGYSLIGEENVENKKPVEWWINAGAAQMRMAPEIIKQNLDKEVDYDTSADLILSTNENVKFSNITTRKTKNIADVEIFELTIKNDKHARNRAVSNGIIQKSVTIYSVENVDVIAILDFQYISDDIWGTDSVVFAKTGDKWAFVFDGRNLGYDEEFASISLKTIADFDNDGKSEYIFNLGSGINEYGYILWHDGITKPLTYKFYSH